MSTVFRGVFADSLGGFLTVRGYARLGDLARCSFADPAYQRELKPLHQSEIEEFFKRREYLFFPEVVAIYYGSPRKTRHTGESRRPVC
ncbi:MAG: hypothetical protein COW48_09450 [Hydrogenophilales bacterium CG17_big_fil_post_rev_8_21_14_2_50_63_12]|nr:MAG: hypothetical protein COW48_09450 [Hydrogenophilales bacterium CG17_big_fil_post_rev_8_21_14_2_50_63_12]